MDHELVLCMGAISTFSPVCSLLGILFVGLNVGFCFAEINDLDYQMFASKRLLEGAGKLADFIICCYENDLLTSITGLQHDRLEFVYKWLSRLRVKWDHYPYGDGLLLLLNLNFKIMIGDPTTDIWVYGLMREFRYFELG